MEDQGADFIQIGASVSVNDEIRANIEEETKELLNFINETKTALENEGGVREKLEKDMMVAKKQTKGIHDDSARVCGDLETFLLTFRGLYHGKVLPGFTLDKQSSLYQGTQHGADETPGVQGEQRSGINDAAAAEQRTREEKEEQIIAHSMREMHKCRDAVAAKHQKLTVDLGRYKAELSESKTVNKELLVKKHRATEEYSRLNAELQDIEAVSKTSSQSLYTEKQRKETLEQKLKELKDSIDKLTQSTSVKKRERENDEKKFSKTKTALETEIAKKEETLREKMDDLIKMEKDKEQACAEMKVLDANYSKFEQWKEVYSAQQDNHQEESEKKKQLVNILGELETESKRLNGKRKRLLDDTERYKKIADEYDIEIAKKRARVESMQNKISLKEEALTELERQLFEKDSNSKTLFENAIREEGKTKMLKSELESAENEEKDFEAAAEKFKRGIAAEIKSDEIKYAELLAFQNELKEEVANMRAKIDAKNLARDETTKELKRRAQVLVLGEQLLVKYKSKERKYSNTKIS